MRKLSMQELGRLSTAEFKSADKLQITVVLDNVRSGLNVGSVFRTCDAFKMERIFICGYSACPPHRDVLKTALGSTESVDWKHFDDTFVAINQLREEGYQIFAVEQAEGSMNLMDFAPKLSDKIALIFGNEVSGVSQEAIHASDACIEVPQWGTKHSLNISVCAGVVLWKAAESMHS